MKDLALISRPSRYSPPGDGIVRDSILATLDSLPEEDRLPFALLFCVNTLDAVADTAMGPAQKRFASGTADAVRDLIPAHVTEQWKHAKGRNR